MYENAYEASLEPRVLAASPVETVVMLYDAAIAAVQKARRCLARGEIMERGRAVTRAVEILTELTQALNHDAGGEISTRLAALYDYIQRRLLDAHFQQQDDGLAESEALLSTLQEGWSEAARSLDVVSSRATPALDATPSELPWETTSTYAGSSQQWNA